MKESEEIEPSHEVLLWHSFELGLNCGFERVLFKQAQFWPYISQSVPKNWFDHQKPEWLAQKTWKTSLNFYRGFFVFQPTWGNWKRRSALRAPCGRLCREYLEHPTTIAEHPSRMLSVCKTRKMSTTSCCQLGTLKRKSPKYYKIVQILVTVTSGVEKSKSSISVAKGLHYSSPWYKGPVPSHKSVSYQVPPRGGGWPSGCIAGSPGWKSYPGSWE